MADPGARPTGSRLFEMPALVDGRTSDRKRRLFAVACLRRLAHRLLDPRSVRALAVAEAFAEGSATEQQRQQAEDEAFDAHVEMREGRMGAQTLVPWTWQGEMLTRAAGLVVSHGLYYAEDVADYARRSLVGPGTTGRADEEEEAIQCRLLEEIVGPARPVRLEPLWLASNDGAAIQLAQWIHLEQAFEGLPILADALEEAGCSDAEMLGHLRVVQGHTRGCWALDVVLGLEPDDRATRMHRDEAPAGHGEHEKARYRR